MNVQGLFHTENITDIDTITESDSTSSTIDYKLYQTLWSLQTYFANPTMLRLGNIEWNGIEWHVIDMLCGWMSCIAVRCAVGMDFQCGKFDT